MKTIFISLLIFFFLVTTLNAQWTIGQDADLVLGQDNFDSRRPNYGGKSASGLNDPTGMVIDHVNGKMYLVDNRNHRVLRFDYPITINNQSAELVFGQPDFTTSTGQSAATQYTFQSPVDVALDDMGTLFVSDEYNHRVVWFNSAHSISSNYPNADGVLGQLDFITDDTRTSQDGMRNPRGIAIDNSNTLWVADWGNSRVLKFNNAANKSNGDNADGVLGQLVFTTSYSGRVRYSPSIGQEKGLNKVRKRVKIGMIRTVIRSTIFS